MYSYITTFLCITFLVICSITDIKDRKVKNAVTFPTIVIGLLLTAVNSLSALAVSVGVIILLFALGFIRQRALGDIKLMMGVVALKGWIASVVSLFAGCLIFVMIFIIKKIIGKENKTAKVPMSPIILVGYLVYEVIIIVTKTG